MEAARNLQLLIQNPDLPADLKHIAEKVLNAERITFDEGVLLFEKGELGYLGILANYIREKRHGDKTVTFILSLPIFAFTTASFVHIQG